MSAAGVSAARVGAGAASGRTSSATDTRLLGADEAAAGSGVAARTLVSAWPDSRTLMLIIIGASLLGLAVLLRLQNGVFCVGLLGILAARRQWRLMGIALATLLVWAFLFGLLDKLTWGGWFHSAVKYLQFNLVEKKAEGWGTAPFGWYVDVLFRSMPLVTVLLAAGVALSAPRAAGLLVTSAVFFLLHSYTPHKELRFLLPMLPLLCALAGVGFAYATERIHPQAGLFGALALTLVSLASGLRAGSLTMGQLGAYQQVRPFSSAWGDFADVNRLLLAASRRTDVCGLKVEAVHQAWTGGETYLHQPVPYYAHNGPPRWSGHYNYVITWAKAAGAGQIVAQEGPVALVKLGDRCVPDPGFNWRLP
ncbi:MAG: hypothetical protein IRZ16_24385 [Myxococcaceae bacterium]|nr:hypothetical protein [Myxococcaceae bacterium]